MAAIKKCYFGDEAVPEFKGGSSHFQLGYLDRVSLWLAAGYTLVVDSPVQTISTVNLSDHVPVSFIIVVLLCLDRTINSAVS